jgi:hypothetical protein
MYDSTLFLETAILKEIVVVSVIILNDSEKRSEVHLGRKYAPVFI